MDHTTNPIMIEPLPEPGNLEATGPQVVDAWRNPQKISPATFTKVGEDCALPFRAGNKGKPSWAAPCLPLRHDLTWTWSGPEATPAGPALPIFGKKQRKPPVVSLNILLECL